MFVTLSSIGLRIISITLSSPRKQESVTLSSPPRVAARGRLQRGSIPSFFLFFSIFISFPCLKAAARDFELSLSGNYQTSYDKNYKYTRTSGNADLSIPLNNYMEFSTGEDVSIEKYDFTDEYRDYLISRGLTLEPGEVVQKTETYDTYANMGFGMYAWNVAPSVFAGLMNRHQCSEDYISGNECDNVPITWNAGAAVSVFVTSHFKLKFTYKISPSVTYYGTKKYDESYTGGISFVN